MKLRVQDERRNRLGDARQYGLLFRRPATLGVRLDEADGGESLSAVNDRHNVKRTRAEPLDEWAEVAISGAFRTHVLYEYGTVIRIDGALRFGDGRVYLQR